MLPVYALLLAVVVDIAIGNLKWLRGVHPKRLINMLTTFLEGVLREKMNFELKTAGMVLVLLVIAIAGLCAWLLSGLGWIAQVLLMALVLSTRLYAAQGMSVLRALRRHDLTLARERVGKLVALDTDRMTEQDVVRACVEYLAHNLADGVVAPILYMAVGSIWGIGPVFGWMYLAVSTLDDQIGYKNDRYIDIGRFAAKLDDVVNWAPARLAGWLTVVGAGILGLDAPGAVRVMDMHHGTQPSPNGGWAMSAFAGALGIQLGGDVRKGGIVLHKRTVGENRRVAEGEDIFRAVKLIWCVANAMTLIGLLLAALL